MSIFTINKSKTLKDLLKKRLVKIVGAHDGLGAKLISEAGFDGVWASGLEISASHGLPDANILTMSEYLERATEMNEATTLPVVADCDTGYGNINNVIHMIEKYEKAGIAAVCIEDKLFPKTNSFIEGRQDLAEIEEFCGKIRAIKETQINPDFMVFARVEALIAGWGMEEALIRANAYSDSGADAILIHSKKENNKEILEFCKKFKKRKPVVVVPTKYPKFHEKDMPKYGISLVIYANHVLRSTIKAVSETLKILKEKKNLSSIENKIAPLAKVFDLQGMNTLKENEKNYLKSFTSDSQLLIPAAGAPPNLKQLRKGDEFIAKNYPVGLIKLNNKNILDRIIESASKNKIDKFSLITGYKSEKFNKYNKKNFKLIKNKNFAKSTQLDSIVMGLDSKLNSIVVFSDLIIESEIINRLISNKKDICLVIDTINENSSKYTDVVFAEKKPFMEGRKLTQHRRNIVKKIVNTPTDKNKNFEFIGACYFSKKGSEILLKEYKKIIKRNKKLDFNSMINHLIKNRIEVSAIEISGGWMEIRSKKHFNLAKNNFSDS